MIVVASKNGEVGIQAAMDVLKGGGNALDAVEAGIRLVEENPEDHSVGYNGWPNILGEAQMDASIMDGRTLQSGAVAAMTRTVYALSVARKVMERLPHVFLVGDGADRFAREMGFDAWPEMFDEDVRSAWQLRMENEMSPDMLAELGERDDLYTWVKLTTDPERTYGTVNFISQDGNGDICSGVSTSGWAWKYPGRIGDSPVIGAGNYADNRYGAAACTGMGEMAIRASTAHSVVFYLKMGMPLTDACSRAMVDLRDLGGPFISTMNLIALDRDGNHAGFTTDKNRKYVYQTGEMDAYAVADRTVVEVERRWDKEVD